MSICLFVKMPVHLSVTGAFTDPSHESSFRAQLSRRLAFPAHVMLLAALVLTLSTSIVLLTSNTASGMHALCMALVVVGCVLVLVVGSVSHYAESEQEKRRLAEEHAEEKLRLEERNEQLQVSNERLLYDVQHRGCDHEEERSTIRRGLQAGLSQPPPPPTGDASSSEAGGPAPSDSPPPSLPPGPPSSSGGSFRCSCRAPDEEAEVTSCLPSWHPPLRQQRVTAPIPSAAAEASSGQKRASLGQVLVDEALAEMEASAEEEASAAVCTSPRTPHTLKASRLCAHTHLVLHRSSSRRRLRVRLRRRCSKLSPTRPTKKQLSLSRSRRRAPCSRSLTR